MRNKRVLAIWLFVVVLALLAFSCVGKKDPNSFYGVVVTGDGSGGAIALYERTIGGDFHMQRISADGEFMWEEGGIFLGKGEGKTNSFFFLRIMGDGAGGAFLSWPDSSQPDHRITSHLARVNRDGNLTGRGIFHISSS